MESHYVSLQSSDSRHIKANSFIIIIRMENDFPKRVLTLYNKCSTFITIGEFFGNFGMKL